MENGNTCQPEQSGLTITQEFLETAFNSKVETFTVSKGSNPGDNYLSIMYAVAVTFKGEKTEKHYLIKCYPNDPRQKAFLDQHKIFAKELFMYAEFFPQIQQLAKDAGADAELALSLPSFHGGNAVGFDITKNFKDTPYANENFIIMGDLRKPAGFRMVDRVHALDIAHAKLALTEMAKLHALTWAYKQNRGLALLTSKYKWFLNMTSTGNVDDWKPVLEGCYNSTVKVVEEALGADHPACKNLKKFFALDFMSIIKESNNLKGLDEYKMEGYLRIKPTDDKHSVIEPWLTGGHGDCWVNNMLFQYEQNKPVGISLVDFQLLHEACPTLDLAYFLFSSVRAPLRIKHENELLCHYFSAFIEFCDELGVKPMAGFTFENLQRRYRRAKIYGLLSSHTVLCLSLKSAEDSKDTLVFSSNDSKDVAQQQEKKITEILATEMNGNGNNNPFKAEMVATVLNLYEEGVI